MQPSALTAASFASYPPKARQLALANLTLLQQLPMVFAALLLREATAYDMRFPAEQRSLDDQFVYLAALTSEDRNRLLHGFASVTTTNEITALDWAQRTQQFSE